MNHEIDYRRFDPCRPLDWRWQRSCWLVEHDRRLPADEDLSVRDAVAYLNAVQLGQDLSSNGVFADVMKATQLRESPLHVRVRVESRILARQSFKAVANVVNVAETTVRTYERLFFNVDERLNARSYVVRFALTPPLRASGEPSSREDCVAYLLRWLGFFGGPAVLDAAEEYFQGEGKATTVDMSALIELLLTLRTMPIDGQFSDQLVDRFASFLDTPQMVAPHLKSPFAGAVDQIVRDYRELNSPAGDDRSELTYTISAADREAGEAA